MYMRSVQRIGYDILKSLGCALYTQKRELNFTTMNTKLKIALLSLLGFSTAACCCTKKSSTKGEDRQNPTIKADSIDTHIILMYGVPFPNGERITPVDDEQAQNRLQEIRTTESEQTDTLTTIGGPALFPDGSQAVPLSEEAETKEVTINKGPALFPDGRAAAPLTEEEAARKVAEMEAKAAEKEAKAAEMEAKAAEKEAQQE